MGREVAVLADLQGPKIRIAKFADAPVLLEPDQAFALECDANALPGDVTRVGVSYLNLYKDVKPGDTLLLDDGLIALRVERIEGTVIHTQVTRRRRAVRPQGHQSPRRRPVAHRAGRQGQAGHQARCGARRGFPRRVVRQVARPTSDEAAS